MLIAGVGGQGSVRASHIVAIGAIEDGLRVRVGETYGAAMRGGSVASHVRMGKKVYSPLIPERGADVILALEPNEGLRNAVKFLADGGLLLSNTHPWIPYDVNIGKAEYPSMDAIERAVRGLGAEIRALDATSLAQEAGNLRTMNVVMLGALVSTGKLPIKAGTLKRAIRENVPKGTEDVNMRAFDLGFKGSK